MSVPNRLPVLRSIDGTHPLAVLSAIDGSRVPQPEGPPPNLVGGEAEGLNALSKTRRREAPELSQGEKSLPDRAGHFLFGPNLFVPTRSSMSLRRQ